MPTSCAKKLPNCITPDIPISVNAVVDVDDAAVTEMR